MNRFTTRTGTAVVAVAAVHAAGRLRRRERRGWRREQPESQRHARPLALDGGPGAQRLRPAAVLAGPVPVLLARSTTRCSSPRRRRGGRQPGRGVLQQRGQHRDHADAARRRHLRRRLGRWTPSWSRPTSTGAATPTCEAYGALAEGQAAAITEVTAPDAQTVVITWAQPQATPERNLNDTAGIIVGPDGHRRPRLARDHAGRLGRLRAQRGRDDPRAARTPSTRMPSAWNADAWAYDTIVYRVITDTAGAGQRRRLRSGRRRRPCSTRATHRHGRVAAEHDEHRRHHRRLPGDRQDRRDQPRVRQRGGPAGHHARYRPRSRWSPTCTRVPAHLPAVPRGPPASTRPWTRSSATTRSGLASCSPRPGYPDGFEFNITRAGPARPRTRSPSRASWPRSASR